MIRSEGFTGYELPPGVRATRILYRSRSQLDHDSVASAVVVVPTHTPPPGGWPALIWAHGAMGVAPACAPSLSKSLGNYAENLVREGLSRGFAVVVVDYSGLGAGLQHEYLWKEANANDIAFAATGISGRPRNHDADLPFGSDELDCRSLSGSPGAEPMQVTGSRLRRCDA
jgi:hypothetical protein